MLPIFGALFASTAQNGRTKQERAQAQRNVPTAFGQPYPFFTNQTYPIFDRRYNDGIAQLYVPLNQKSQAYGNWYTNGVNTVLSEPQRDFTPRELEAVNSARFYMPMSARGIPNQGLDVPHLNVIARESMQLPFFHEHVTEFDIPKHDWHIVGGPKPDRTTDMGALHTPREFYSVDAMSEGLDQRMKSAGVPYFLPQVRRPYREAAQEILAENEASYAAYRSAA